MSTLADWLPGALPRLFDEREVQDELTDRLAEIDPRLRWEIGPFGDGAAFLAFSPNGYPDLLPVSEALAGAMPPVDGWRFFGAKPRKQWSVRKVAAGGAEYFFDGWRYRLVSFKGGEFFDIEFFTFDEAVEASGRGRWLGEFLASSELGEKLFMRAVDRVEVYVRPGAGETSIPVASLYEQIVDLFKGELPAE